MAQESGFSQVGCDSLNQLIREIFERDRFEKQAVREQAQALEEAMMRKNCSGLADALNLLGIIHFNKKELLTAKQLLLQADSLSSNQGTDSEAYVRSQLWLGLTDLLERRVESAQLYFDKAVRLSQKISFEKGLLQAYLNLGTAAIAQDSLSIAEAHLFRALQVNEQLQNRLWGGYVYLNLARIASARERYSEALAYNQRAEAIWEQLDFP